MTVAIYVACLAVVVLLELIFMMLKDIRDELRTIRSRRKEG